MKEEPLDIFIPPIFTIVSIETSLERNNVIYSRKIRAVHKSGRSYEFIERSNIPVEKYLGTAVECIVEVIEAEFYTPEDEKEKRKLPVTIEKGEYLWTESGDKFIPELVEMVEGHHNDEEYEYDDEEFERLSIDYLKKWGVSGLGLATHQSKPMVRTKEGVFLFNEYQNEEVIEQWERNQTIYFKPIKMLLRGIKIPTATKEKRHYKAKKSIIESQDPSVYKMYNGKNYTESEWKIKEQELWEEYTGNKNKKKENKKQFPPSRFFRLTYSVNYMKEIYEYPYQNLLLEDMEDEIWKDIPDYEGYYQVSNLGRIKSLARELNFYREGKYRVRRVLKCDKIIKQYSRKNMINSFTGKAVYHLTCSIKTESTLFSGSVARLVYRTFVKDINKSKQRIIISHYDEDSLNNHVNNLYPQTYTELNLRNIKAGRLRTPKINELPVDVYNKICKGKCISIAQYTLDGEFIGTYPSISNAVKKYNMSFSSIIKALKYSNRTCCGFIWKKINAEEKLTSPKLL